MTALGIIGSAGRGTDRDRMSAALFQAMCAKAADEVVRTSATGVVSGGAAFADHIAVRLYLDGVVPALRLYLPAQFDGKAFVQKRSPQDPGLVSNRYHASFRTSCGVDGLSEIAEAIRKGAVATTHFGFKTRNLEVAHHADYLLAFTFGHADGIYSPDDAGFGDHVKAGLKDGGTAHCWNQCWRAMEKIHVNLFALAKPLK